MRLRLALCLCLALSPCWSAQPVNTEDHPLRNLLTELQRKTTATDDGLMVQASGQVKDGHLVLTFHLKNVSATTLSIYKTSLPWGNAYATTFVAMTADGVVIRMGYPIDDHFVHPKVEIHPGETLVGDYDLSQMMGPTPSNADLLIFWTYSGKSCIICQPELAVHTGIASIRTGP